MLGKAIIHLTLCLHCTCSYLIEARQKESEFKGQEVSKDKRNASIISRMLQQGDHTQMVCYVVLPYILSFYMYLERAFA